MMINHITRYKINMLMWLNISCLKIDKTPSFQDFIAF